MQFLHQNPVKIKDNRAASRTEVKSGVSDYMSSVPRKHAAGSFVTARHSHKNSLIDTSGAN